MRNPRARQRLPGGQESRGSTDVRGVLNQSNLRQAAGIEDQGEVLTCVVEHPDGDNPVVVDSDKKEIRVWLKDVITQRHLLVTLFAPHNVLWRKPKPGDSANAIRGAHTGGPSAGTALHADGSTSSNTVPDSLTDDNTVLSPPKGDLVCESRDGKLDLDAHTTTNVNGDDYHLPKWDDAESDLETFLTTVSTITPPVSLPTALTAIASIITAAADFLTAAQAAQGYKSQKAKNG